MKYCLRHILPTNKIQSLSYTNEFKLDFVWYIFYKYAINWSDQ